MKHILINTILIHIVFSFLGKFIKLYFPPTISENSIIDLLNMNQRKIITSSFIIGISVFLATYLAEYNIKINEPLNLYIQKTFN